MDFVVHSTDCDLSINDLWSSFREELTIHRPHRLTRSRNVLPNVSPSLKCLMRKRDRPHARKDPRYKTIKREVQKKLLPHNGSMWKRLLPQ